MQIKMSDLRGRKDDEIPWCCFKHQTRLIEAEFTPFPIPERDHYAKLKITVISVGSCTCAEVQNKTCKWKSRG